MALHFAVNDVGMVFFFALATKEIVEATLPGGAARFPREAAVPVLAAVGGMVATCQPSTSLRRTSSAVPTCSPAGRFRARRTSPSPISPRG